jgi:adenine/guanine/hypoxanthine permease
MSNPLAPNTIEKNLISPEINDKNNHQILRATDSSSLSILERIEKMFHRKIFHLKERGVTVRSEIYCGLIQFVSCCYVLPVVPTQLEQAGYDASATIIVTALMTGIGCIAAGVLSDLPFIIAPPTAVSIFLSVSIRKIQLSQSHANTAVAISGLLMCGFMYRPFLKTLRILIPPSIQIATAIGIGLLTALAGAVEVNLVVSGEYTILDLGHISDDILLYFTGVGM